MPARWCGSAPFPLLSIPMAVLSAPSSALVPAAPAAVGPVCSLQRVAPQGAPGKSASLWQLGIAGRSPAPSSSPAAPGASTDGGSRAPFVMGGCSCGARRCGRHQPTAQSPASAAARRGASLDSTSHPPHAMTVTTRSAVRVRLAPFSQTPCAAGGLSCWRETAASQRGHDAASTPPLHRRPRSAAASALPLACGRDLRRRDQQRLQP